MKLPSLKAAIMFFVGVIVSLVALRFIPVEWKAKIGL